MNLYQKNLLFLKNNAKPIYEAVAKHEVIYPLKIDKIDGENNCIAESGQSRCFLHSAYNKLGECSNMFREVDEETSTVILFGLGYGYALRYLQKNKKTVKHVIIIEPSLQIYKEFINLVDVESLLKTLPKITFILNSTPESTAITLQSLIEKDLNTNIRFVYSVTYVTLFRDYYEKLDSSVVDLIRRSRMSSATSFTNTYKYIVNIMKNISIEAKTAEILDCVLAKFPVAIVSAGPSLNQDMDKIEELKKKAIVIAVGTAIEILDQNNIAPHIRAAFSPTKDTTIFKNLKNENVPLIFTNILYFDILPDYKGEKFRIVSDNDVLSRYIYDKAGFSNKVLVTELSIANVIFEYLASIGCKDIILIGQDLAYTNNTMYADGSLENINVTKDTMGLVKELNAKGNEIFTDTKFMSMRDAFVRSFFRNRLDGSGITNTCMEGLYIPNTVYMCLTEKLEKMPYIPEMKNELGALLGENYRIDGSYREKILGVIAEVSREIQQIKEISELRVEKLKDAIKSREDGEIANKVLMEYADINKIESELLAVPFYDKVSKHELQGNYTSIISAFKYDGADQDKQLEAVENILVRVGLELRTYCEIFEALISEYANENTDTEGQAV